MTKACDAYNVQNDPAEKCRKCAEGTWSEPATWFDEARSQAMEGA